MSDDTDDFDWFDKNAPIIVRSQPGIAVYLNPHDEVVIRQEGHYGPEEDRWIYITKDNVPRVVQAMLEAAGFETATTYGEPLMLPKPEPLSGAQRQKRYRNKHRNGNGNAERHESDELPLRPVTNGHDLELAS
ncbi:MAG: hypothetical protein ACLQF1_13405 [Methyloceanibacter sp.]